MDLLTRNDLKAMRGHTEPPCVSVFIPTHRVRAEEDAIRWKNCLNRAEEQLVKWGLRSPEARDLLVPARAKQDDTQFWNHQSDGLACFLASGMARFYRLPLSLAEQVVVAPHFHIKPLFPILERNYRFFLLALSEKHVRLYQGNGWTIEAVDLEGVPASLADALRYDEKISQLQWRKQPAVGTGGAHGQGGPMMFHGHGVGIDDEKNDLLRYFQQIDRGLHDYLNGVSAPLALAGVEYLWPIYRRANTYPHLLEEGVPGNPDRTHPQVLHAKAWPIVRKAFPDARRRELERFGHLAGTEPGKVSADLGTIVAAAAAGRVETLFLRDSNFCRWGAWNPDTGEVTLHDVQQPKSEDLLNLAALETLGNEGNIYVLPEGEVPGGGDVAAVFRWPEK
ncbi:MAG TPA: hypothetical protein VIL46_19075 [Gemmataceae bacterium]